MWVFRFVSYTNMHVVLQCMDGSYFSWFSKKWNVYDNFYMLIPCASPNSNILTNFVCWSILVSEICVFNLKKVMNNSENCPFQFDTLPTVEMDPFLIKLDIVTMMSLEVQMNPQWRWKLQFPNVHTCWTTTAIPICAILPYSAIIMGNAKMDI